MRQLNRLLRYMKPYWFYLIASVLSMAVVGLLDAFRVLLVGPIFDRVLNPSSQSRDLPLFRVPGPSKPFNWAGLSRSTSTTSGPWWLLPWSWPPL